MSEDPKGLTVHMIGNAHLDPVWLWRWTEGYEALVATFRSALDLMRENEHFCFTCAAAAMYAWIERNEPGMFAEIRQRVAEGRWEIAGGWWLQPDCNIPCGESLVRQALYGQGYFRERLGVMATVGYNVDTFGHAGTLPQFLAKAGLRGYVFFRPAPDEKELPEGMFWWESPDGTRVLTCRPPGHYPYWEDEVAPRVREHASRVVRGLRDVPSFYGVGNHGGGPTRGQIAAIVAADRDPAMPNVVFGRLDEFFDRARAQRQDYPVVRDELQHHARGCYTSHAPVKRWNREAEALLGTAEAFAALASEVAGLPYPHEHFTRAWRNVLFNQFHDILAGSSIPEAYEDARDMYGESNTLARWALWSAVQRLARRVDTRAEGDAVLVFNPLPWRVQMPIHASVPFNPRERTVGIVRHDGEPVPAQTVQSTALSWTRASRMLWVDELPPLGYRLYFVREGAGATVSRAPRSASGQFLENERWRIEVDPQGGHVASLKDKVEDVEVFSGPAAVPLVIDDQGDTWAHGVESFGDVAGRFENATVSMEEEGPVRATLRVVSTHGRSVITQLFRLYHACPLIEVEAEIDWHEQYRMLKLAFPVNVRDAAITSSIPYGHITREPNGEEEPCGPWVDVTGQNEAGAYGLTVVNDSKHGYDASGSEIRLSVLRSPIYAWDLNTRPEPGRTYRFMDQGLSRLRYFLVPHRGAWQDAGVARLGLAINRPPVVVNEFGHEGSAPPEWCGAEAGPENIVLSALKQAQDGNGLIVRLWETAGRDTEGWLKLHESGAEWQGRVGANEVKTLRAERTAGGWRWQETDLLEQPLE